MTSIGSKVTWEMAVQQLRAQPESRTLVEACFYDDPLLDAAKRYHASSEWRAVRDLVDQRPTRALDIGSGRGISAYALASDGWQVTALEPDPSEVVGAGAIRTLAREAGLAIDVAETWGESLPFPDASFELVHCRQVLHHARSLPQLCSEVARVLVPGGMLLATREHVISRPEDLPAFLDSHPLHRLYGGEHAYLLDEYRDAMASAGLVVERVLNPLQSEINTYPDALADIKARWARKVALPTGAWIPDAVLAWVADRSDVPGRLYSFVGRKPSHAAS